MFNTIKVQRNEARINKDSLKASLLTTLQGEIETASSRDNKEVTDEMCIKCIKTFLKGINEIMLLTFSPDAIKEKEILEALLPKQLTEKEIRDIIQDILNQDTNVSMGLVMNTLKQNHAGLYDGKLASQIFRELHNV